MPPLSLLAVALTASLVAVPAAGASGSTEGTPTAVRTEHPPRAGWPPVPEPAGLPLAVSGLALLALAWRRIATLGPETP